MHTTLAALGRTAKDPTFAALCNLLSFYEPGTVIDEAECAKVIGTTPTMVAFYLDTLVEMAVVIGPPPYSGGTVQPMQRAA